MTAAVIRSALGARVAVGLVILVLGRFESVFLDKAMWDL